MAKEYLSYDATMQRLSQVRDTAIRITQVLDGQVKVAAQFRDCISEVERANRKDVEKEHTDAGWNNKWKHVVYGLVITSAVMDMAIQLYWKEPIKAVEAAIFHGVILFLVSKFWKKNSPVFMGLKLFVTFGLAYSIVDFFSRSLSDVGFGIFWFFVAGAVGLVGAGLFIPWLIPRLNARIDRNNARIRQHNQQVDQEIDAQNRQITARNQELTRQYQQLSLQLQQLRQQLELLTSGGWYPLNQGSDSYFYTVQGIDDLIDTLSGPRANTIQEALNAIEKRNYRAQNLAYQEAILRANSQIAINQQRIASQLRFANLLTCAQIHLQQQQNDAIHRMEETIYRNSQTRY